MNRRERIAQSWDFRYTMDIVLKKGKDRPVRAGHPWIFSGAIDRVQPKGKPGEIGTIKASSGEVLGQGYCNLSSSISVRVLTRGDEQFTPQLLFERIACSVSRRRGMFDNQTTAYRLINSEGDFLPGLIVDRYGDGLCVQLLTAGMRMMRESIIGALKETCTPQFIYERSDAESVSREKIQSVNDLIWGEMPRERVIRENDLCYEVDLAGGQKTGLFLDQRENRALVRRYASGACVADCFCYTGGFSLNALKGGAERVISVDASRKALEQAKKNRVLNRFGCQEQDFAAASVFNFLREVNESFSLIILDPPKFARHHGERQKAARGYKDVNLLALKALAPGGVLFTFSCSQAIDPQLFRQIIFGAAVDAQRQVQLLDTPGQPFDHPTNIAHREGEYLKGLVLRVV
ncbi:MAG: class I SAM-dependent rRNA methyltransferase [Chitinispirillaceae bacterium]